MKKYVALSGEAYYPNGFDDYIGDFSTIDEAKASIRAVEWIDVIEHSTMELVYRGRRRGSWIGDTKVWQQWS